MGGKETEACGRCAMSSVVDVTTEDGGDRNPFEGDRIEVAERDLRTVSPAAWLGGVKRRLDAVATRLAYRR